MKMCHNIISQFYSSHDKDWTISYPLDLKRTKGLPRIVSTDPTTFFVRNKKRLVSTVLSVFNNKVPILLEFGTRCNQRLNTDFTVSSKNVLLQLNRHKKIFYVTAVRQHDTSIIKSLI